VPTYEYRCKECGNELEVVQSFTDDALTTCERCGGPLRKVFGNVGIAFKGSGFYKNDSRGSSSKSSSSSSDGGSSTTADAGSSSSSDAGSTSSSDKAAKPATPAKGAKGDKASASSGSTS
jgi:putative FmdB family regulatory protein